MDPQLTSSLIVYGPLGVWAILATSAVIKLWRENTRLHEARVADAVAVGKDRAADAAAQALAMGSKLEAIGTAHALALRERDQAMRERDDRTDRQQTELGQRLIGIVTTVTDKLGALSDAIAARRTPR